MKEMKTRYLLYVTIASLSFCFAVPYISNETLDETIPEILSNILSNGKDFDAFPSYMDNETSEEPTSDLFWDEDDDTNSSDTVFIDGSPSLEEFCIIINISLADCTCDILPFLCREVETFVNNTLSNITRKTYWRSQSFTIAYASVTMVTSIFGIFGNMAVLLVAYRHRQHLPSGKLHIAELALVNFIFCLVQMINTIPLYWTNKWVYSPSVCKFIRGTMEFANLMTIGFIVIIAVERYFLISYPLHSKCTQENFRHSLVVINFIACIATVIPFFIGVGVDSDGRCIMFEGNTAHMFLPYTWFVVIVYSLIPIIITTVLYIKIAKLLSMQPSTLQNAHSNINQQQMLNINRRIVCITMFTLLAFILCTLPTRAISIYMAMIHYRLDNMNTYMTLAFVSYFTYPLQSTLNPILYSTIAKEWRKEMCRTVRQGRVSFFNSLNRYTSSNRTVPVGSERTGETNF